MSRYVRSLFSALFLILSLSCVPGQVDTYRKSVGYPASQILSERGQTQVSFEDRTEEIVGHAERLIEKNQNEGAVLDPRWYTLKRFAAYQNAIFSASQIIFYGGLENDVRRHTEGRYSSVVPVENDQEPGEIRLFIGKRTAARHDLIIVGQNGREVALKTMIRLLYLAKFVDDKTLRKYRGQLQNFRQSLRVWMSSFKARQEFTHFFNRYGISSPDVVIIGFIGDSRALMQEEGIEDPQSYSDESLRVNWYTRANGRNVLLVSIDHNRIFASRAGELMEAIFDLSGDNPPSVIFLGSGGAIDEPQIVGRIVTPTVVLNGDPFPETQPQGGLVHIIRNKAVEDGAVKTAHASVENVVVETTQWANRMKRNRIRTVDQELFHLIRAINSSANALKVETFIGILVTDDVSSVAGTNGDLTLQHAEERIVKTAGARREFLSGVLAKIGVLKHDRTRIRRQKETAS
jgi:hypothetical protein